VSHIVLSLEDHALLVQKANAWDRYVRARLDEGFCRGITEVTCVSGAAEMRVHDMVIITPFGSSKVLMNADGNFYAHMHPGDSIKINHEVKLRIS
jgi:hypothetical protein